MKKLNYNIPLFDIDWTLIRGGSQVHKKSYIYALNKLFSININIEKLNTEGMVDSEILYRLAIGGGLDKNKVICKLPELIELMDEHYLSNIKKEKYFTMPGAEELLIYLKNMKVEVGVLTGNTRKIGRYKLKSAGLMKYITYEIYGDMSLKRDMLVKFAKKIVLENNPMKRNFDLIIVGDTPRDVTVAKNNKLKCIAVATGKYKCSELKNADMVVENLEDKNKIFNFLRA